MTHPDDRLAGLFAADLPAARDHGFQIQVLEKMARRRFLEDLGLLSAFTTASAVGLWLIWPLLVTVIRAMGEGLAPGLVAVTVAASILALTSGWTPARRS